MELFIYDGVGKLPSIDFDCLRILAYVKFKEIPVTVSTDGNPFHSPNGFLPYIKDSDGKVAGYDEIISYFQSKGFDGDEFISSSYLCHFESQFMPYFYYVLFGDPRNIDTTRALYAKRLPFPCNFIYPHRYTKHTSDYLKIVGNFSIDDKLEHHNTADMILNAKRYINMLAERFEKKRWFFGGPKPDECDATIYAALSILLHLQLPHNDLKSHITECPKVMSYIDRVSKKYLDNFRTADQSETAPTTTNTIFNHVHGIFINKDKGTLSNTMVKILFGILTISTMTVFAISHGILEVATDDDDDDGIGTMQFDDTENFSEE